MPPRAQRVTESNDASAPASPVQQPTEPTAPAPTATLTASSEAATPRPSARKAASKPVPKRKELALTPPLVYGASFSTLRRRIGRHLRLGNLSYSRMSYRISRYVVAYMPAGTPVWVFVVAIS
ncbi:hypothetical protein L209DRAFT_744832 [Thermothelomyces heterothallicus CBS 203.75]